jgi:hypothetical protein
MYIKSGRTKGQGGLLKDGAPILCQNTAFKIKKYCFNPISIS